MASQLEGVKEATAALNELGVKLAARELKGTVKAALEIAEHKARAKMPRGSQPHKTYKGRLVSPGYAVSTLHIETRLDKKRGAAVAFLGVGREAFYEVQFQELGTRFQPAQPWLRPSFVESEDPMLRQIGVELTERVKTIAAKSMSRRRQRSRFY
jgi:HK97 gp10 family phage protein